MPRAEEAEVKRKRLRSIVEPAGFGWRHWRWHVAVNSLGNIINIYTNDGMIIDLTRSRPSLTLPFYRVVFLIESRRFWLRAEGAAQIR